MRDVQERGSPPSLTRHNRGRPRSLVVALAAAAMVVAADQATKSWATDRLSRGSIHVVWTLDLSLQYNSGSAFSLFTGWAPLLGAVAVVFVAVLIGIALRVRRTSLAIALGLIVGGALGNLSDRIFRTHHGAVVDWIDFHWWPTFNLADASIVVGGILLVILVWRRPPHEVGEAP